MGGGDSVLCALSFPGLSARSPLWAVHRMANYRDEPRTPDVDWGREKVVVVGGGFGRGGGAGRGCGWGVGRGVSLDKEKGHKIKPEKKAKRTTGLTLN